MIEVRETEAFRDWLGGLADDVAVAAIAERLRRFSRGLFGDVKSVGGRVCKARVHVGPGYRVYYVKQGLQVVVLLSGGHKRSQRRDIRAAIATAEEL